MKDKHELDLLIDFETIKYEDATQFWNEIGDVENRLNTLLFRTSDNSKSLNNEYYVVKLDYCNSKGEIDHSEILFYRSFTQANETLNKHEYSPNMAVELYVVDETTSTAVLHKCFDGTNYSRLAHCKPQIYRSEEMTIMRTLFDTKAKLYK